MRVLQLRSALEYRGDFWLSILGAVLQQLTGVVFAVVLFTSVPDVLGWGPWEVALLFGLVMLPAGLVELLSDGPWSLRTTVNSGSFDRVLLRPLPPALQVAAEHFTVHGLGNALLGAVLVVAGLTGADAWRWWTVPFLVLTVVAGTVLVTAVTFLANMVVFWEPSATSTFPVFVVLTRDFAKFPLDLYPPALQVVLSSLPPFAFTSCFPALLLLDRGGSLRWLGLATPLVAALVALLAAVAWRAALRRYEGAGH
nr:ABC-2 family transporter protein [Kineococcus siccus]